ncbi:MAG: sulfonate transporter [Rhodospirillales bacterium]|nr:sulfonate transporter [Rhodospirillales bacterium]
MSERSLIVPRRRLDRRRLRLGAAPRWISRLPALLWPLALPAIVLLGWQVATTRGWLAPQILPAPAAVVATLIDLARDGDITSNLAISLWRIVSGFAIGAGAGIVFGVALGVSPRLERFLGPSFRAVAQVPSLGWLPFLILIFGIGETLNYVIIAKACFVPVVLNTAGGIRNIPRQYLEVADAFRLTRTTRIFRLILPAALPQVFSGIRLALSHAWIALLVVEMLADTEGVGYMMTWGRTLFQIDVVLAGMVLIGIIGFVMDAGLRRAEKRLRRWVPADG